MPEERDYTYEVWIIDKKGEIIDRMPFEKTIEKTS